MASRKKTGAYAASTVNVPALLVTFALCFLVFVLFTEKLTWQELVLAAVCSVAVSAFSCLLYQCAPPVKFRARDVAEGWHVPVYILQQVPQITWLLMRDLCGRCVGSHFLQTGFFGNGPAHADTGRRILATAYTTAAPNFIVLQIDAQHHRMHYHQISTTEVPQMTQNLGAKP